MRKVLLMIAAAAIAAGTAFGQMTPDPAVQEMRAKLEVVYDLGRIFGYIQTMDKEQKKLALTSDQAKALAAMGNKILKIPRFEPKEAEAMLVEIEEKILKPDQLMYVDGLAIARASERPATAGTGAGSAGGTSPVQSYMNGGPFNPMQDTTKKIGQDFKAAVDYFRAKK